MRAILLVVLLASAGTRAAEGPSFTMLAIPGGSYVMGDAQGSANEAPRRVSVKPFAIMKFEVTNARLAAFVKATGSVTDVEKNNEGYVWTDTWHRIEQSSGCPLRPERENRWRLDHRSRRGEG